MLTGVSDEHLINTDDSSIITTAVQVRDFDRNYYKQSLPELELEKYKKSFKGFPKSTMNVVYVTTLPPPSTSVFFFLFFIKTNWGMIPRGH